MRDKIVELRASLKDLPIEEIRQKLPNMMEYVRQGETAIPFDKICSINADVQQYVKKYFE